MAGVRECDSEVLAGRRDGDVRRTKTQRIVGL